MSNTLSFITPTTTSSTSSLLAKGLEPVKHTGEAVAIKSVGQPTVDKKLWEESVKNVIKTHYKTLEALKNK